MATIRKRGEHQWEAQVRRRGFPAQSKTHIYKADAEAWAKMIESEMDRGVFVPRGESERVTLSELIDRYLHEVTPSKKNWKSEGEILARIKLRFGSHCLAALSSAEVAAYRNELLTAGRAASTVGHYLNALSCVIGQATKEWGYPLPANPVRNVKRPAQPRGRERRLRPGEEKRILRECRRYRNPVLEPLVRLALETAMRQGELFALTWEDVDLVKAVAMLRDSKNGETRAVPLSTTAVAILRELRGSGGVVELRGKVLRANVAASRIAFMRAVERARSRYCAACKRIRRDPDPRFLADLTFHDLRHEATSRLFELGTIDMMEVASITGHKTLSMLKRYTHLRAENLAKMLG